jgi:hypothetical protein
MGERLLRGDPLIGVEAEERDEEVEGIVLRLGGQLAAKHVPRNLLDRADVVL